MGEPGTRGKARRGVEIIAQITDQIPQINELDDRGDVVTDILTNLRHYCQCFGLSFQAHLAMSKTHYNAEKIKRFPASFKAGL